MAKLPKDVLLEKVRKYVGDRTDDETLEIIEDISDSVDTTDADEWKQKFEENDKMWRDKYISRFFDKKEEELETPTEHEEEEKEYSSFEDLFKEEEN
ncbi:MAG: hypothetical protein [Bacteriophage sp.]|nr:MAG: hypothetical protein [Bacteriophage sp.]